MMDVSPRPLKNTDSVSPAPAAPVVAITSNAQLANMLSDAYRDVEALRRDLAVERKRADNFERILAILKVADTPSPSNGTASIDLADVPKNPDMRKVVEEYEKRIIEIESARDEAETRRREALDAWRQLDDYLTTLELSARDARAAFSRTRLSDEAHGGPFSLSIPHTPFFSPSSTHLSQSMAPPNNLPLRTHSSSSRRPSSRAPPMVGLPLPPHPIPNPTPVSGAGLPSSTGARRPRTPSIDSMYAAAQPPSKRSRGSLEDQRGREPRSSYSDTYSAYPQQQVQSPSDTRGEYNDAYRARAQQHIANSRQQQLQQQQQPEPRIIDRRYGSSLALPPHESSSHSRSGSHSSASSMDVDEMIIKASTADEVAAANNGGAAGYPPQYQHLQSQQQHLGIQPGGSSSISSPHRRARGLERDRERGDGSPRLNTSPPVPTSNNPYPPAYPASQSAPGSMRSVAGGSSGSQVLLTTHVFAPVVTGAPTKKTKFPNTPGSNPSLDTPQTPASTAVPPAVPFPPTNPQGQRICRQCGMVGRYKDGKCVEKWGPGPMGPGTVCDRCRKKMKRVERRGTLESQAQLASLAIQQQQHQPLPRTTSHPQLPLSQSSDRSIHRTDTVLAHHATMSSSSSLRDNLRHSSRTTTSSAVKQQHRQQQHQPTPPTIASLRDDVEEEEEAEGDQLPTSNVGRGAGRSNGPKNSKDVGPDATAEAEAEILGAVDAAAAGGSADGDGDADGEEADAEAELLEAVDAAEANSTSSGGERERGWLKAEPN